MAPTQGNRNQKGHETLPINEEGHGKAEKNAHVSKKWIAITIVLVVIVVLVGIALGIYFGVRDDEEEEEVTVGGVPVDGATPAEVEEEQGAQTARKLLRKLLLPDL